MSTSCIVHATDFSDTAEAADAQARALARALGAELVFLHVTSDPMLYGETPFGRAHLAQVYEAQRDWARQALEARVASARAAGLPARAVIETGTPADVIVRAAAAEQAAMIVMGTHGRGGLHRLMIGSVADRVVRTAPCPVLLVRAGESRAPAA